MVMDGVSTSTIHQFPVSQKVQFQSYLYNPIQPSNHQTILPTPSIPTSTPGDAKLSKPGVAPATLGAIDARPQDAAPSRGDGSPAAPDPDPGPASLRRRRPPPSLSVTACTWSPGEADELMM